MRDDTAFAVADRSLRIVSQDYWMAVAHDGKVRGGAPFKAFELFFFFLLELDSKFPLLSASADSTYVTP